MAPVPWSADNERGVSALQVLVDWLTSRDAATGQSNYAQWLNGHWDSRQANYDEILGLFEINGIRDRTKHGLALKLGKLKSQVSDARMLMTAHGLEGKTDLEGCDQKLRDDVLRICPSFERLAPVVIPLLPPASAVKPKRSAKPAVSSPLQVHDRDEAEEELHGRQAAENGEPAQPEERQRKRTISSSENDGSGPMSHLQQMYELDLENKRRQNEHEESGRKIERLLMKVRAKKELMELGLSEEQAEHELERI